MAIERMIYMDVRENINLNGAIVVKNSAGAEVPVINLFASLDGVNKNVTISANTVNKALAADPANTITIQTQYGEFYATVQARAKQLGLVIFE